jgi:hypothetical protein
MSVVSVIVSAPHDRNNHIHFFGDSYIPRDTKLRSVKHCGIDMYDVSILFGWLRRRA